MNHSQVDSGWDYDTPHTINFVVGSEHIDGLRHTNNAHYVAWCEKAAWTHSEQLGMSVDDYQRLDRGMAIRHAEYDYAAATFEGDELVVGTWLSSPDNKLTMVRRFQIIRLADQQTVVRGEWQLVCIELSSSKPKKFPKEFVDAYSPAFILFN